MCEGLCLWICFGGMPVQCSVACAGGGTIGLWTTRYESFTFASGEVRRLYPLYELIDRPTDTAVYRNPFTTLQQTLQCIQPTAQQIAEKTNEADLDPLRSVDFSCLRRLKIFGDTNLMPITDSDVSAIAKTATGLREFHLTCNSSTTIDSVVAVADASFKTLRVLEHSPRSRNGFSHPYPGSPDGGGRHYCTMFRKLPKLETLSVSLPSICAEFFSNEFSRFSGHLQQARTLIQYSSQGPTSSHLHVELFFAGYIFEPGSRCVHGDFSMAQRQSRGRWPLTAVLSSKGPYGRTGLYGADEDITFQRVEEEEFLCGDQWLSPL
ncbi:hypothetical protein TW65_09328 [Stemphylium lycopersici]|nr:hypothetical protein TW65_09328 [Stemphylium lycopersici]